MSLVNIQGLVTYYKIQGKGKPLILLHGWGGSSKSFSEVTRILSRSMRVITLDLPGFGQTDAPLKPWGIENYADFLLAFTKRLQLDIFSLGGYSFGGRVALWFSSHNPEKIQNLILIAAAGIKHEKSAEEKLAGFLSKMGKKLFSLPVLNKVQDPARWLFYKMIRRSDYYQASQMMREIMRLVIEKDLTTLLPTIKNPTLIIWGSKDDIVPLNDAYLLKNRISHSQLNIIKGANHYLPKKYPKEVAALIKKFLQTV